MEVVNLPKMIDYIEQNKREFKHPILWSLNSLDFDLHSWPRTGWTGPLFQEVVEEESLNVQLTQKSLPVLIRPTVGTEHSLSVHFYSKSRLQPSPLYYSRNT